MKFGNLGFQGHNGSGFGFAFLLSGEAQHLGDMNGIFLAQRFETRIVFQIIIPLWHTQAALAD